MNPLLALFGLFVTLLVLRNFAAVLTVMVAGYMVVMCGLWLHDLGSRAVRKVASWR